MSNNRYKYNVDINSLDNINCEEKAYFLGFFFADGHNSNRNDIMIGIQERDGYILKSFLEILKSNHPIRTTEINGNKYKHLGINNKHLSDKLREYGVNSNKSLNAKFPNFISDNLVRHFIRGYFDGDGSIDDKNPRVSMIGTFEMMRDIATIVESQIGIKGIVKEESRSEKVYYYYIYGGNKCEKFLDYIYNDNSICLDRKYKKYLSLQNRSRDGWKTRKDKYGDKGNSKREIYELIIEHICSDDKKEYDKRELLSIFLEEDKLNKANIAYHINKTIKNCDKYDLDISNGYGKIKVNRRVII